MRSVKSRNCIQYTILGGQYNFRHCDGKTLIFVTVIREFPISIYFFKINNRSTRKKSEICSKLTIKTPES